MSRPPTVVVELLDGGAGDQLAPQALERRRQERVGKGEVGDACARAHRPAGTRRRGCRGAAAPHRAASTGRRAGCRRAGAAARRRPGWRAADSSASSTMFIRSGPVMVSVDHSISPAGAEHGDAGGARQERAHQAHVGIEADAGLSGDVLLAGDRLVHVPWDRRISGCDNGPAYDCAYVVSGPCASWRNLRGGAAPEAKTLNPVTGRGGRGKAPREARGPRGRGS